MWRCAGVVAAACITAVLAACSSGGSSSSSGPSSVPKGDVLTARVADPELRPADVELAREILRSRFTGAGFPGVEVDNDAHRQTVTVHFSAGTVPSLRLAKLLLETAELRFRLVQGTIPYSGKVAAPANAASSTCRDGAAVTPDGSTQQVILPDKDKHYCYLLGPTVLTGRGIGSAVAVVNEATGQWQVDVHFDNNDFVTKIAQPDVGKQIAIVVDGIVQSAPTVNYGITGQDV